ncbi:MAG TPA: apolipoprotein N-acyltransferase [Candidatus Margulisiibacteriota bacterium]|nr:apolipoprotein N-acyltransferase [Candidatus Margulisiibacteriota bacterium]
MLRSRLKTKDYLLSFSSALLLILSFPGFNLWPFAWFGFVPVFLALNNKSIKDAFLLFFITGVIFWTGIIYWLVHVTLAGTILLILFLSLYFALFGLIIRPCTKDSTLYTLVFIPAVWVLLEYARSHLLTGFPWALLGYSQYLNLPVIQIADITGPWGVSFLLMLSNVAIVEIIWSGKKAFWPRLKITVILLAAVLSLVLSYGYLRLSRTPPPAADTVRISLIQGNIPQELKWHVASREYISSKYLELSSAAMKDGADLLLWPEAALPAILEEEPSFFERAKGFAETNRVNLLLGAVTLRDTLYYNSAILVYPNRQTLRYDKMHLVPFGEYIPLKNVFPFLQTIVPIGDVTAGKEYTIFRIRGREGKASFAVLICFEDLFPELSREFAKRGARLLVNITNDAWYKKTSAASQHLQGSVFRAVENRLPLVRAANTGISAFISPEGKLLATVKDRLGREIFIDGFQTQSLSLYAGSLSFYTRYGDLFIFFCLLLALYAIIIPLKT